MDCGSLTVSGIVAATVCGQFKRMSRCAGAYAAPPISRSAPMRSTLMSLLRTLLRTLFRTLLRTLFRTLLRTLFRTSPQAIRKVPHVPSIHPSRQTDARPVNGGIARCHSM
jgi:hypothetical protein